MDDKLIGLRETRSILAMTLSKKIIVKELGTDEAEVIPEALLAEDLGAEPWDLVELFMAVEEAFEVKIPDQSAERLRTVQHLVNYISKHAALRTLLPIESWHGQIKHSATARDYD